MVHVIAGQAKLGQLRSYNDRLGQDKPG